MDDKSVSLQNGWDSAIEAISLVSSYINSKEDKGEALDIAIRKIDSDEPTARALVFIVSARLANIFEYVNYYGDEHFPRSREDELDVAGVLVRALWPRLRLLDGLVSVEDSTAVFLSLFSDGLRSLDVAAASNVILGFAWCLIGPYDEIDLIHEKYLSGKWRDAGAWPCVRLENQ